MSLKRILVAYAGNPAESGGLNLAINLASRHGASLTAVAALGPSHIEDGYQTYINAEIRKILAARDTSAVNCAEARFQEALQAAGFVGDQRFTSIGVKCDVHIADLAHGYDLVVYCDHPVEQDRAHLSQTIRELVLSAAGPVLFIPSKFTGSSVDGPALLAWDKQAKSGRAISDALQLGLLDAGAVLTEIGTGDDLDAPATRVLIERLKHHGIDASYQVLPRAQRSISQCLMQAAGAQKAAMIVMGAFEHSPLREDILGGVTLDMMAQQDWPVLFSH